MGNDGLLLACASRRDHPWSTAVRTFASHHGVVATDVRGRALQELLRRTNCTVWVEGHALEPLHRVLVALDPYAPESVTVRLVDLGVLLARVTGAELFALHVWDAPGEPLLELHCSSRTVHEYVDARLSEARIAHDEALSRACIDEQHRWCERGNASAVISTVARERAIDAVVVGMSSRPPLARTLLGCTAVRVARRAACHVLVAASGEATPCASALPRATALRGAA